MILGGMLTGAMSTKDETEYGPKKGEKIIKEAKEIGFL